MAVADEPVVIPSTAQTAPRHIRSVPGGQCIVWASSWWGKMERRFPATRCLRRCSAYAACTNYGTRLILNCLRPNFSGRCGAPTWAYHATNLAQGIRIRRIRRSAVRGKWHRHDAWRRVKTLGGNEVAEGGTPLHIQEHENPLRCKGFLAGAAGFEPTNAGVKVPCLTAWRHPNAPQMDTRGKEKMG